MSSRSKSRSPIFAAAVAQYAACRADYGIYLEGVFSQASDATNGTLLNKRGKGNGIDPFTLFSGNEARALAYASEELVEWWSSHPRMPFSAFERMWFESPNDYSEEPLDMAVL